MGVGRGGDGQVTFEATWFVEGVDRCGRLRHLVVTVEEWWSGLMSGLALHVGCGGVAVVVWAWWCARQPGYQSTIEEFKNHNLGFTW